MTTTNTYMKTAILWTRTYRQQNNVYCVVCKQYCAKYREHQCWANWRQSETTISQLQYGFMVDRLRWLSVYKTATTKTQRNKTDRISCFVDREWVTIRVVFVWKEIKKSTAWRVFPLLFFFCFHLKIYHSPIEIVCHRQHTFHIICGIFVTFITQKNRRQFPRIMH